MISISVCLFLAVLATMRNVVADPMESPNQPTKKDGDECDATSLNSIVCTNDRLQFCGPNNEIMSIPCTVMGKQGYCNCEKTACVPEKPTCSDTKTKCYQPGTKLPDNLDCHKFSYCDENREKTTLRCPGNLIYNPTEEKCLDQSVSRCARVNCPLPGNTLQLIPFPQAKNYYLLCYKGIGDVRKCSDPYYSVKNNVCQFDCRLKNASGLFKDSNKERCEQGIYYACRKAGTNFTTVQVKCNTGMTFNEKLGICQKGNFCAEPQQQN